MTTIDWIILLIIALYAFFGVRRGFVATVAYTFGSLISLVAALIAASYFKQPVGEILMPYAAGSVVERMPELTQAVNSVEDTWNNISGYLQGILASHGVSLDVLQSSQNPQQALANAISRSVSETAAYILVFIAAFFITKLLLHVIVSALGVLTNLPVLHSCNALLGGVLGAATGLVLCTCVMWALKLFVPAVYSDVGFLSPSVMENSSIARHLVGWNDGVSLFEANPTEA
ncbi:CvpA family protein [Butyricicoccus sp.]|uniref:CvpA family protein n=1 Tax=Butyricicoccus sp. TaxID=2049021 RepID=UPI003F148131